MNKAYLGVGVAIIVAVAGVYFVLSQSVAEQVSIKPIDTATSSVATTATTTEEGESNDIELDLSKLQGKDRLYTEEEGKYENLSEEEREMMHKFLCKKYNYDVVSCSKITNKIAYTDYRLVGLKDTVAIIRFDSSEMKLVRIVYIFDMITDTLVEDENRGNFAFGPKFIIKDTAGGGYKDEFINLNYATSSTLLLYRPGMKNFVEIPDSRLDSSATYLKWEGDIFRSFPVEFNGDTITVNIYSYDCAGSVVSEYSMSPIMCTNVLEGIRTFDLSNLP